jgi:hypothetical protein
VDPSKIQGVLSWNAATNVGDIQSFLRFSKITKPVA